MLKRIEPEHKEAFSIEDARQYAEMAKKSAKMMFSACLKEIKKLDVKGKHLLGLVWLCLSAIYRHTTQGSIRQR